MAAGQKTNQLVVPQAQKAMEQFKYETASEVGLNWTGGYGGDIPSTMGSCWWSNGEKNDSILPTAGSKHHSNYPAWSVTIVILQSGFTGPAFSFNYVTFRLRNFQPKYSWGL